MPEQAEKLRQEILADARRRAERNRKRAEQEAQKIVREAEQAVERLRRERLAQAEHEAEQVARTILAGVDQEVRRNRLRRRERVIQEVYRKALASLRDAPPEKTRRILARLITMALQQIGPNQAVRVHVRPDQADVITSDLMASCARQAFGESAVAPEFEVTPDEDIRTGGVLVETKDGRLLCDNTFEARLQRLDLDVRPHILRILSGGPPADAEATPPEKESES